MLLGLVTTAELLKLAARFVLPLVVAGLRSFEQSHIDELHAFLQREIPSSQWCNVAWENVQGLIDLLMSAAVQVATELEGGSPLVGDAAAAKVVSLVLARI